MISMHKYIATETMVLGLAPVTSFSFRGEINDEERSAVLIALLSFVPSGSGSLVQKTDQIHGTKSENNANCHPLNA
jgi:hypothetical protein